MEKVIAINSKSPEKMLVSWDLGRRCNFDCTYCESSRHNLYSPPTDFEELTQTFEFIKNYVKLYNQTKINVNFTGGEPTVNPKFWDLAYYMYQSGIVELGLTTNGTYDPKKIDFIQKYFNSVTVSWHAESDKKIRDRVLDNIMALHKIGKPISVNIMMHVDYWNEAVKIYTFLKANGVRCNPVPIGDGNLGYTDWFLDDEGVNRRTSHRYNKTQQEWFWNAHGIDKVSAQKIIAGNDIGRTCCGGRCLTGKTKNGWKPVKMINSHFKDWFCTINFYFLHIEQHTGNVYHHQTCQATFDGKGPIGNLKDTAAILKATKIYLENPKPIQCPNDRCGCGMCVPKAKDYNDFEPMWNKLLN
jgi:sulfatase maturation enzyme AslB (radical SAM superfamily)